KHFCQSCNGSNIEKMCGAVHSLLSLRQKESYARLESQVIHMPHSLSVRRAKMNMCLVGVMDEDTRVLLRVEAEHLHSFVLRLKRSLCRLMILASVRCTIRCQRDDMPFYQCRSALQQTGKRLRYIQSLPLRLCGQKLLQRIISLDRA